MGTRGGQLRFGAFVIISAFLGVALAARLLAAEPSIPPRIVQPVDDRDGVILRGNTTLLASPEADQGRADPAQQIPIMMLVLQRSEAQEQALAAFNERQYDSTSPDYHHWLQPDEFGRIYGPSNADVSAVTAWLQRQGFRVDPATRGKALIPFSGRVAQVEAAFHVEMHRYLVGGAVHLANDRDPQIPRALAPVITGIASLNDFDLSLQPRTHQYAKRNLTTGKTTLLQPDLSYPIGTSATGNDVTPYDLATIYNSLPLWTASPAINGTGIGVAVLASADVLKSDYTTYRSVFGLPATTVQVLYSTTTNPGYAGNGENTEDVEMVSAAAPGATITLVTGPNGSVGGLLSAGIYAVDANSWPIITASYGECEAELGASANAAFNAVWQQGATQGISIFVAAGDQGSTGCTSQNPPTGVIAYADQHGLAVNGMASSPYVTAVGGTDLAWNWIQNGQSLYWNATASKYAKYGESATGYMPEISWNTTCANPLMVNYFSTTEKYATTEAVCNGIKLSADFDPLVHISGGSGGVSDCTTGTSAGDTDLSECTGGYPKPSWQKGTGVPADGKRDLPDIAMFASYGWPSGPAGIYAEIVFGSAYMVCWTGGGSPCVYDSALDEILYQRNGGTSAATPYSAGVMAMLLQKLGGARQGLANPTFYALASAQSEKGLNCNANSETISSACYFHDVTTGSNAQPCGYISKPVAPGLNCVIKTSGDTLGIASGYAAGTGYDQTTGVGTMNIANIVDAWTSVSPVATLVASSALFSFPSTAVGAVSATQTLTLRNTGAVAVSLSSGGITLGGAQASSFVKTATTCGTSLVKGGSCTVTLAFKPVAAGSASATLAVSDNATGSPQQIALGGTGTAPASSLTLSPGSLAFASTDVGATSEAQAVTLKNSGKATITLKSISLSGTDPKSFIDLSACGASLAAAATCQVLVSFHPAASGAQSATLSISSSAASAAQTITVSGTAAAQDTIKLTPATLSFATTTHGTMSEASVLTVSNAGSAAATIDQIAITGANSADFEELNTCGATLAAGATCSIYVSFVPAAAASYAATVVVYDNAAGSPQTVALSGKGD
jgi:Pro-kumamolisin, activation domain